MPTVVGGEKDVGVVEDPSVLELLHNSLDEIVQRLQGFDTTFVQGVYLQDLVIAESGLSTYPRLFVGDIPLVERWRSRCLVSVVGVQVTRGRVRRPVRCN